MMRTVNNINDKARRHDEQLTAKSCPMSTTYLEVLRWGEAQSCHPVRPICRYFSVFWQFRCQEDPGHSMHPMPEHTGQGSSFEPGIHKTHRLGHWLADVLRLCADRESIDENEVELLLEILSCCSVVKETRNKK